MRWEIITDTNFPPIGVDILVKGGKLLSEFDRKEGEEYKVAHVKRGLYLLDEDGDYDWINSEVTHEYLVENRCYYEVWVENPTHYVILGDL